MTPEQQAALTQQINTPEFQAAYQQALRDIPRAMIRHTAMPGQILDRLYQQFGIQMPHDYELATGPNGQLTVNRKGFYDRNSDWIPAAAIGGGFLASALAPAAAAVPAATSGAPAAAAVPAATVPAAAATGGALSTAATALSAFGRGVGDATQAAGENRLTADEVRRRGEQDYETGLENRSLLESRERTNANKDAYRASWYQTRQPGPNNTAGITQPSANYMGTLSTLEQQAMEQLSKPPQYNTANIPALRPFAPTPPSGAERAGTYAAPALGGLASILRFFGR